MAKYLLLKHYRGAPAPVNDVPMDQWAPDEVDAHVQFMRDFAARLERTGARQRRPDGSVDARRGRRTHEVHERLRRSAAAHR